MNCDRNLFISNINSFLRETKSYLSSVLSELNWSEASLISHKCHSVNFDDCYVNSEGNATDENLHVNVDRSASLADCETILSEMEASSLPPPKQREKETSLIDKLSLERDLKRRRISYKGRVHTKHKSQNEILRQVIAQQMETLGESIPGEVAADESAERARVAATVIDLSHFHVARNPHVAWKYIGRVGLSESDKELYRDKETKYKNSVSAIETNQNHRHRERRHSDNRDAKNDSQSKDHCPNSKNNRSHSEVKMHRRRMDREEISRSAASPPSSDNVYRNEKNSISKGEKESVRYHHRKDGGGDRDHRDRVDNSRERYYREKGYYDDNRTKGSDKDRTKNTKNSRNHDEVTSSEDDTRRVKKKKKKKRSHSRSRDKPKKKEKRFRSRDT